MSAEKVVEEIVNELDKTVLLSAAWDCMSEGKKEQFRRKLEHIITKKPDNKNICPYGCCAEDVAS